MTRAAMRVIRTCRFSPYFVSLSICLASVSGHSSISPVPTAAASRTAGFIDTWAIAVASSWNAISLLRFHCPPARGTFRRAGCQVPVAGTAGHRVTAPPATRRLPLPLRGVVTSDRYAAAVSPDPRRMRTFSRASPQPSSLCIVRPAHAALTRLAPQGRHM